MMAVVMPVAKILRVLGILLVASLVAFLAGDFTDAQRVTLGIFLAAAGLWVTESIPPFATAIVVIVLQVFLLGRPGGPLALEEQGITTSYQVFLNPLASPTIILFFGGFVLAAAARKHGLDAMLAAVFLGPFRRSPAMLLLGVILVTAGLSMFMSNTATAAMMIAVLTPVILAIAPEDPFRKAMCLAIAFAANLGGIGTVIGSPPNAVAASFLGSIGRPVTFLDWMRFGLPFALVMLAVLWVALLVMFRPANNQVPTLKLARPKWTPPLVIVLLTFGFTVLLWVTEVIHGMPAPVAALFPVLIFTACGILDAGDLKRIDWDVLILIAGGLSLGVAVQLSGLSERLAGVFQLIGVSGLLLVFAVAGLTIVLSNFMSNTSAANIMIPLAAALPAFAPTTGAVIVAISASLAMSLPVSTPPNAIVHATRFVSSRDMIGVGTLISLVGLAILLGAAAWFKL